MTSGIFYLTQVITEHGTARYNLIAETCMCLGVVEIAHLHGPPPDWSDTVSEPVR